MESLKRFALAACVALVGAASVWPVGAQESSQQYQAEQASRVLRIGVVDLARLIKSSPQAKHARTSMAKQFAKRKNALEAASEALQQDMDRLKDDGASMDEDERKTLQTSIRDRQRKLQMRQSEYNDDVTDAEQAEFDAMRDDLRSVIDNYARTNDYDLILGDGVLYSTDAVDVTDEILAELEAR